MDKAASARINTQVIKAKYVGTPELMSRCFFSFKAAMARQSAESLKELNEKRKSCAERIRRLKRAARSRGYKNGLAGARLELQERFLQAHLTYLHIVRQANQDCLAASITVAREVVAQELKTSKKSTAERIGKVLGGLLEKRSLQVMVNPEDLNAVENTLQEAFPAAPIKLQPMPRIARGNALIKTLAGEIELSWEEHLRLLSEQLQGRVDLILAKAPD